MSSWFWDLFTEQPKDNFPKDKAGKLQYLENYPQTSEMLKCMEERYELIGNLLGRED